MNTILWAKFVLAAAVFVAVTSTEIQTREEQRNISGIQPQTFPRGGWIPIPLPTKPRPTGTTSTTPATPNTCTLIIACTDSSSPSCAASAPCDLTNTANAIGPCYPTKVGCTGAHAATPVCAC